jgi:hypothetical protein
MTLNHRIAPEFVRSSTRGALSTKQSNIRKRQGNVRDRTFCYHLLFKDGKKVKSKTNFVSWCECENIKLDPTVEIEMPM